MMLPHLAAHLYGVPLLIHRPKLDLILAVLGQRMLPSAGPMLPTTLPWSQPEQPTRDVPEGIAVLEIHGTLVRRSLGLDAQSGLTPYPAIAEALESALADPAVAGIFLDIDSAGGEAGGVFDLADRLYAARQVKPIWAIADDMAFSAAYALASSAEKVWITRTGGVGSIGVIALHVDQSLKDAEDGLKFTPIFAGSHKNDLNPHEPLKDEARVRLQTEVDRLYGLFLATVARNRQQSLASIQATEAGLFHGPASLEHGLADAVGSRAEALQQFATYLAMRQRPVVTGLLATPPAQRPVALPTSKEMTMSDDSPQHPAPPEATPPQLHQTIQSGPVSLSLTTLEAVEIAQLCTLAGCPERIVTFLETGSRPEQVRKALLDAKAQSAPEILSWLDGHATQTETALSRPMLAAAKRLGDRQASLRKEH